MANIEKIGLGTVQFGVDYGISNSNGKTTLNEVNKILNYCKSSVITTIDTAFGYGESEKVLGSFDLNEFDIISKFLPSLITGKNLSKQFNNSLANLGVERFYGYMAHRPLDLLENPEQWELISELKEQGKINKIGYSLNTLNELDQLLEKGLLPDIIQAPFNYFDRRFLSRFKELKKLNNCEIHTRSTFLQGLFFMNVRDLSSYFDPVKEQIISLQNDSNNLASSLLKFALDQENIDKVIVGVNTREQLAGNISGLENARDLMIGLGLSHENPILIPSNWPK